MNKFTIEVRKTADDAFFARVIETDSQASRPDLHDAVNAAISAAESVFAERYANAEKLPNEGRCRVCSGEYVTKYEAGTSIFVNCVDCGHRWRLVDTR